MPAPDTDNLPQPLSNLCTVGRVLSAAETKSRSDQAHERKIRTTLFLGIERGGRSNNYKGMVFLMTNAGQLEICMRSISAASLVRVASKM